MSNYQESEVSGTSWLRARRITIENPYNQLPMVSILEEKAIQLGDTIIFQTNTLLGCDFDPANQLHLDLNEKLVALYNALCTIRDTPVEPVTLPELPVPDDPPAPEEPPQPE